MKDDAYASDLVLLTADKNTMFAVEGLLNRPRAVGIQPVKAVFYVHPERDPGCLLRADSFLRPFAKRFAHAIVMFDREGCGRQQESREELEAEVTSALSRSGWRDRAASIVIDPELENWVFSDSPEVDMVIGWAGRTPPLRTWLEQEGLLEMDQVKPSRPKEAMEAALRQVRMPRSSSIYAQLSERVSLERCTDPAFLKLKTTLQEWFRAPEKAQ